MTHLAITKVDVLAQLDSFAVCRGYRLGGHLKDPWILPELLWDRTALIAEKNPVPLVASFDLGTGAQGFVSTRIKMGKTGDVVAVVKSGGKLYSARKGVKVTIGGCGG